MRTLRGTVLLSLVLSIPTFAQPMETYRITVTNLTRGQIISPPIVALHSVRTSIFHPGATASNAVAAVAEDADASLMLAALADDARVSDFAIGDGPLLPGDSATFDLLGGGPYARLSALGMLVTTNDAFFGIDSFIVTGNPWMKRVEAPAYDAGSEANNESCAFIPGPPCGNAGVRAPAGAEGVIHTHSGVYGIGDLDPATHDWRNPVALVTVVRVDS